MKHIKELKLNEGLKSNDYFDEIQKMIIGNLIEDYEFTDSFLEKPEVKEIIKIYTLNITRKYYSIVNECGKELEKMV